MRETTRTIMTAVTVATVMALLMPVGAQAAGQLMTIVDANSDAKAQVDSGKLRVGDGNGAMTVNGTVGTSYSGRTPYADSCHLYADGYVQDECTFDAVPAGKVLVITNISAHINVPVTQGLIQFHIDITPSARLFIGWDQNTNRDPWRLFTYDHHTEVAVPGGVAPRVSVARTDPAGVLGGDVHIVGYLTTP